MFALEPRPSLLVPRHHNGVPVDQNVRGGWIADDGEHAGDYAFPEEHWRRIRTNNPLERILREIQRRVVGALNLAAAGLRHIVGTAWSTLSGVVTIGKLN